MARCSSVSQLVSGNSTRAWCMGTDISSTDLQYIVSAYKEPARSSLNIKGSRLIGVWVTMHFPKAAYPIDSLRNSADAAMQGDRILYLVVSCPRRDLGALRDDERSSRGLLWYPNEMAPDCSCLCFALFMLQVRRPNSRLRKGLEISFRLQRLLPLRELLSPPVGTCDRAPLCRSAWCDSSSRSFTRGAMSHIQFLSDAAVWCSTLHPVLGQRSCRRVWVLVSVGCLSRPLRKRPQRKIKKETRTEAASRRSIVEEYLGALPRDGSFPSHHIPASYSQVTTTATGLSYCCVVSFVEWHLPLCSFELMRSFSSCSMLIFQYGYSWPSYPRCIFRLQLLCI